MITDRIILFVTQNNNIPLQLKELSHSEDKYQVITSSEFSANIKSDLIFFDYSLLPEHYWQLLPQQANYFVLFNIFEEEKIIQILNQGALGYILQPVTASVIKAIIQSFLRRNNFENTIPESIVFGNCTFYLLNLTVTSPEGTIHLTPSEAGILKQLLINRGRPCLRKHLLEEIKDHSQEIISRNVDVHIASLRKKLGSYGKKISTIRGIGYVFSDNDL
ncbi:winged helix family transcriptional regulator [Chlamydia gallinacea]|uniref:Transcriptional regulator n=2 Tax=Chlamydia gallinacea TaxID=1457153 RepID=A0A173DYR6_9CHLA|nr:response regulator transcription factor [Chlamydia gallinacea]EYE60622.1 transcriptional regulatory family protein [Bacteroides fragilis str. S6L5]ANG66071.1 transcriptional regulator [Chlamydia gallinacea 08-1274/3]AQT77708.1 transcriptional regulator [Chlamydia gallinacea]MBX6680020.1 response regulator transcription factor [Chlamydia gallinacea]MBX6687252.1 response regulator transcription factor [Chlamydia gallinacea]